MARKKKNVEAYRFSELSAEAKKMAVQSWRGKNLERLFDQDDSDSLTKWFHQELEEGYHLGAFAVYWSLGNSQGDGVAFEGTVDLEGFLRAEKKLRKFGALIDRATAKIKHEGRYYHSNSMTITVESDVDARAFLSPRMLERYETFVSESRLRSQEQWGAQARRARPIQDWQSTVQDYERQVKKGKYVKQDWTPRGPVPPGPRPPEADVPVPPDLAMDPELKEAWEHAEEDFKKFESLMTDFEEYLSGRVQEISKELEKAGYDEIDYHQGDEFIADRLDAMDYQYTEEGEPLED